MIKIFSLMAYAGVEHRIRQSLIEQNRTFTDMKKITQRTSEN
ncbi:hypothetical protein HCUR_00849 [Holospora curviuscula]|uniref:Uncharacterized protein n=1 Tax=Holospora curviuscula TaxID=1082868 RepID=A0A2S5R8T0_9PROT|nr:hypothetical protein HCUR_00849 [Holospora curviuscula]